MLATKLSAAYQNSADEAVAFREFSESLPQSQIASWEEDLKKYISGKSNSNPYQSVMIGKNPSISVLLQFDLIIYR